MLRFRQLYPVALDVQFATMALEAGVFRLGEARGQSELSGRDFKRPRESTGAWHKRLRTSASFRREIYASPATL
jgi:hypothetical protein